MKDITELGRTYLVEHQINTGTNLPIRKIPYRLAPVETQFVKKEVKKILKHKIIKESTSAWAFPIVVVKKARKARNY